MPAERLSDAARRRSSARRSARPARDLATTRSGTASRYAGRCGACRAGSMERAGTRAAAPAGAQGALRRLRAGARPGRAAARRLHRGRVTRRATRIPTGMAAGAAADERTSSSASARCAPSGALLRRRAGRRRPRRADRGPAGIGKSRLLQLARRRGEAAGALVLAARSSELEREFPYGVVRQLLRGASSPTRRCASARSPARRAPRARCSRRSSRRPSADAPTPRSPRCTGFLAHAQPRRRPAARARGRRPALVRPPVAALPRLPHAPARGPADPARGHARTTEPGTDPALLSEIANDLATSPVRPGPLTGAAVGDARPRDARAEATPRSPPPSTARPAGTRCSIRQLLRALEAEGVRPDAASAGIVREIGPGAVARTVLCGSRASRRRRWRSPARSRCSARARAWPPSPRSPRSTRRRSPRAAGRARPRGDPARRSRRSGSSTRSCATRSTASCRTASARSGTSARSRVLQALGAPAEPGRRAAAHRAAAGRRRGRRAAARRRPRRVRPRRARQRHRPARPRARRAARAGSGARRSCSTSGWPRCSSTARAAVEHLRAAYAGIADPVARARMATLFTQILTFTGAPEESVRGRRRGARRAARRTSATSAGGWRRSAPSPSSGAAATCGR